MDKSGKDIQLKVENFSLQERGEKMKKKFEYPQMVILTRSTREAAYGPENPYHCTFKSCCFEGK